MKVIFTCSRSCVLFSCVRLRDFGNPVEIVQFQRYCTVVRLYKNVLPWNIIMYSTYYCLLMGKHLAGLTLRGFVHC